MFFRPFDYIKLASGDHACIMWRNMKHFSTVAYPWYSYQARNNESSLERPGTLRFGKIYLDKQRSALDQFMHSNYENALVEDPIGGCMIDVRRCNIECRFDGLAHFQNVFSNHRSLDLRPLVDLLGVSPNVLGTTGSWLLGKAVPTDLDIVVHDFDAGKSAANAIRRYIRRHAAAQLPGYWNRPYHHRRFRHSNWEICLRSYPPTYVTDTFTCQSSLLGTVSGVTCEVVDDTFGHCTPSIYSVSLETSGDIYSRGQVIQLISSESKHAFAFSNGDRLYLDGVLILSNDPLNTYLSCQMGDVDAIRPI